MPSVLSQAVRQATYAVTYPWSTSLSNHYGQRWQNTVSAEERQLKQVQQVELLEK